MTCLLIMMIIQNCIECKILGKQNWRMRILGANFGGGENSTHFNRIFQQMQWKKIGACVPPAPVFFLVFWRENSQNQTALEDESLNSRDNICFRLASSSWFSNLTGHILERDSLLFCKSFLSFAFDLPFEVSETLNSQSVRKKNYKKKSVNAIRFKSCFSFFMSHNDRVEFARMKYER